MATTIFLTLSCSSGTWIHVQYEVEILLTLCFFQTGNYSKWYGTTLFKRYVKTNKVIFLSDYFESE